MFNALSVHLKELHKLNISILVNVNINIVAIIGRRSSKTCQINACWWAFKINANKYYVL